MTPPPPPKKKKKKKKKKKERKKFSHSSFEHSGTFEFKTRLSITLFNLFAYEHGVPVAQWVKHWPTDTAYEQPAKTAFFFTAIPPPSPLPNWTLNAQLLIQLAMRASTILCRVLFFHGQQMRI